MKKALKSHKTVERRVSKIFLFVDGKIQIQSRIRLRIRIRGSPDPDPDPDTDPLK
jgi:hypothetical protein